MPTRYQLRHVCASLIVFGVLSVPLMRGSALARLPRPTPDRVNNPGRTTPPEFSTCGDAACHGGGPTANCGMPTVEIKQANGDAWPPACYDGGQVFNLTVTVTDPDTTRKRWGFAVGVQYNEGNSMDGVQAGTLDNDGGLTAKVDAPAGGRHQIGHDNSKSDGTWNGTYQGKAGSATWPFKWTAPTSHQTPVRFYLCGVAADNDGSDSGDRTCCRTYDINPCTTPLEGRTWGSLKIRHRP